MVGENLLLWGRFLSSHDAGRRTITSAVDNSESVIPILCQDLHVRAQTCTYSVNWCRTEKILFRIKHELHRLTTYFTKINYYLFIYAYQLLQSYMIIITFTLIKKFRFTSHLLIYNSFYLKYFYMHSGMFILFVLIIILTFCSR